MKKTTPWGKVLSSEEFKRDIKVIVENLKNQIDPDEIEEGDENPSIELTVGMNNTGKWGWQSGDNSYSGGAYGYRPWAVAYIYKDASPRDILRDITEQIEEAIPNTWLSEDQQSIEEDTKALVSTYHRGVRIVDGQTVYMYDNQLGKIVLCPDNESFPYCRIVCNNPEHRLCEILEILSANVNCPLDIVRMLLFADWCNQSGTDEYIISGYRAVRSMWKKKILEKAWQGFTYCHDGKVCVSANVSKAEVFMYLLERLY